MGFRMEHRLGSNKLRVNWVKWMAALENSRSIRPRRHQPLTYCSSGERWAVDGEKKISFGFSLERLLECTKILRSVVSVSEILDKSGGV